MTDLPLHKATQISASGISLKTITPASGRENINYSHRDDYYIFGLLGEGECRICIDFKEYHLSKGETMFIQPGQVHHFVSSAHLSACLLITDSTFVSDTARNCFDEYAFHLSPFQPEARQQSEVKQLFVMLSNRINRPEDKQTKEIVRDLASAFIGIIAEAVQSATPAHPGGNQRQKEIALAFRNLLKEAFRANKRPSYYASRLNISTVYLNEVIKSVTGMSAGQYIRHEVMLQARRLLFHTDKTVQEVALALGYEDYAYFTRQFTKATGISPSLFRRKYLG